jgi:hypothetical protein
MDFLFKRPVLFCEFSKVGRDRHQLPPVEIADIEIVPHVSRVVQRVVEECLNVLIFVTLRR